MQASSANTTDAIRPSTIAALQRFFPRWKGDASEPALPAPPPKGPAPAAVVRQRLERAVENAIAALDDFDGDADLEDQCEDEGAQCDDEGAIDARDLVLA